MSELCWATVKGTLTFVTHILSFYSFSLPFRPTSRSQTAIISIEPITVIFLNVKAYVANFDIPIKLVKITPGLYLEQTIMGLSPMLHTKISRNQPTG